MNKLIGAITKLRVRKVIKSICDRTIYYMTGGEIIPIVQELIGKIDPAIQEAAVKGLAVVFGKTSRTLMF